MAQVAVLEAELEARHEQELQAFNEHDASTAVVSYGHVMLHDVLCYIKSFISCCSCVLWPRHASFDSFTYVVQISNFISVFTQCEDHFFCVSVCEHISGTAGFIFTKFFVARSFCVDVAIRYVLLVLWMTSHLDVWWLVALQYRGTVWCLWMPCLFCDNLRQDVLSINFCRVNVGFSDYTRK